MEKTPQHQEELETTLDKNVEQKQPVKQREEEKEQLIVAAHAKASNDNERLQQLREREQEDSIESLKKDWQDFYRDVFKVESDFSKINIPEKQEGFERLIIMEKGMTAQHLLDKCRELFPTHVWYETSMPKNNVKIGTPSKSLLKKLATSVFSLKDNVRSLDNLVISDRSAAEQSYAVWVKDNIGIVNENLPNFSANDLKEKGIATQTLEEALLELIRYFKQTGKFPVGDEHGAERSTCAGSRFTADAAMGNVPDLRFQRDESGEDKLFVIDKCNDYNKLGRYTQQVTS